MGNLWARCAQLFSETLLPNMSLTKTLNQTKVLETPNTKQKRRTEKSKNLSPSTHRSSVGLPCHEPRKAGRVKDYGGKKFARREDKKLEIVVQDVWDSQLHDELEKELAGLE